MNKKEIKWNNNLEIIVKNIGEEAMGYKVMHLQSAKKSMNIYNFLMYIGIIIGPLSGFISGFGTIYEPNENVYPILSTILSFLSGILISIIKFGSFKENSDAHKTSASKYISIESNIRRQLNLPRENRTSYEEYYSWLSSTYEDIFVSSPFISSEIYKKYIKKAKEHNIKVPEEYGITINVIDEEKKSDNLISRSNAVLNISDINKYNDNKMLYEINRMLKK